MKSLDCRDGRRASRRCSISRLSPPLRPLTPFLSAHTYTSHSNEYEDIDGSRGSKKPNLVAYHKFGC